MGKKTYTVQWTPDITVTAGSGSVSIGTPTGGGTSISNLSNLVPRCSCCQFCPFTDGAIYTSLPSQIKCTLTDEFHFCDDTHCDVKEKVISIEWLKEHLPNDEDYIRFKGYHDLPENDLMNIAYDKGFTNGWEAFRKAFIEDTISEWEKENE